MTEEPEPVNLPIEDSLDLHVFAPRDVRPVVDEYLKEAAVRGFREVRLIHGRGIGVQRASVLRGLGYLLRAADGSGITSGDSPCLT